MWHGPGKARASIDITALYYTLSTVAQALAGALGAVGAFALFRMTRLEADIAAAQEAMRSASILVEDWWPVLRDHGPDVLLKRLQEQLSITYDQGHTGRWRDGHAAWQTFRRIRTPLAAAVIVTALDVVVCLVALPFVPHLAHSTWLSSVVVGVVLTGVGVCLVLFLRLILLIVEPRQ
jgi:hypothetical protein